MAALTADVHIPHKGTPTLMKLPCTAADTFYAGALVFIDVSANTGQVQVGSLAATDVLVGICAKQTVTTAQTDLVPVYVDGIWALELSAVVATDVGSYAVCDADATWTDNEADAVAAVDITLAANDVLIGPILSMHEDISTRVWVKLTPGAVYSATLGWVNPI